MVDNKSVKKQVHELQFIVISLRSLKIVLLESFHVMASMAKSPPYWEDNAKRQ